MASSSSSSALASSSYTFSLTSCSSSFHPHHHHPPSFLCLPPTFQFTPAAALKVHPLCIATRTRSTPIPTIRNQQYHPHESKHMRANATSEHKDSLKLRLAFVAAGSALLLTGSHVIPPEAAGQEELYQTYFGTAASASSYGGYGGNSSKRDSAEYTFDVPQGWKERQISKVEKGTNGTDSEFYNPRRKEEKVYLTYLPGFRRLAPRDSVLNNLALSDVSLQDMLSQAESVKAVDKTDSNGQLYYDYEIDSPIAHSLISVTCAKNKLYAHFVKAPVPDWNRDESLLRHVHDSFTTVGPAPALASP